MNETLFKHHPDNWIYLYHDGEELKCSLAEFLTQEPDYALPDRDGIIMQAYVPGVRHVYNSNNNQFPGEMPWPEGDRYLDNIANYRAAIEKARKNAMDEAEMERGKAYDALPESEKAKRELIISDGSMIRVIEDIWNILKAKKLANDDDLPNDFVRAKLANRRSLREKL